jgi:hypothetical protein
MIIVGFKKDYGLIFNLTGRLDDLARFKMDYFCAGLILLVADAHMHFTPIHGIDFRRKRLHLLLYFSCPWWTSCMGFLGLMPLKRQGLRCVAIFLFEHRSHLAISLMSS